jgi:hypothetical protein
VSAAHSIGLALEGVGRINRVKNGTGKVDGNFRVAPVEAEGVGGGLGGVLDGSGLRSQRIWNRASLKNRMAVQGFGERLGGRQRGCEVP